MGLPTARFPDSPQAPHSPPAPPKEDSPQLPEGWVKFDSATHNRPFYYNKETKTTVWQRPTDPVEGDRPQSPSGPPQQEKASSPKGVKAEDQVVVFPVEAPIETKVASGSSEADPVASAYAARRTMTTDAPKGPAKWADGVDQYHPRRVRSPSPRGEPAKRFRRDDGGRSPPLSARLAAMDRSTFLSAFIDSAIRFGVRKQSTGFVLVKVTCRA